MVTPSASLSFYHWSPQFGQKELPTFVSLQNWLCSDAANRNPEELSSGDFQHHSTFLTAGWEVSATTGLNTAEYFQYCIWTMSPLWEHVKAVNQGWNCTWSDRHTKHQPTAARVQGPNSHGSRHTKLTLLLPRGAIWTSVYPKKALLCVFWWEDGRWSECFWRTQILWGPDSHSIGLQKSGELFTPTVPSPSGCCKLGLQKTATTLRVHRENEQEFPEEGTSLMIWEHGSLPAQGLSAAEKSAGEIPDCSLSREKLRMSVFKGLQPTTSAKNTIFS